MEEVLGSTLPIHLVLHDRSGAAAVIEWVGGERTVHENPVGVATNSPPFQWHLTNLRNYVNLRAVNVDALELDGLTLSAIGEGSGLLGLPGDWTPPSRFVRATAIAQATQEIDDADQAVGAALHIANAFDIPKGVVRDPHGGDFTAWISIADLANGRYVLRTYEDPTPRSLSLGDLDLSAGAPVLKAPLPSEPAIQGFVL
jgi:choloylglycine hydrolase